MRPTARHVAKAVLVFKMTDQRITALSVQKRNPDRVNVYLDNEFAFGLSRIVAAWLTPGQLISQQQIEELVQKDAAEVGFQKAIRLLDYKPRTEQEIRTKLKQKGFEAEQIEPIVQRLVSSHLVQDEQYAASWIENRNQFRPSGQRVLRYELWQKGINEDIIERALVSSENEMALARRAAQKMTRRLANLDWQEYRKKLGAFLARRGFTYDTVVQVVKSTWEQAQSEETIIENEELGK